MATGLAVALFEEIKRRESSVNSPAPDPLLDEWMPNHALEHASMRSRGISGSDRLAIRGAVSVIDSCIRSQRRKLTGRDFGQWFHPLEERFGRFEPLFD